VSSAGDARGSLVVGLDVRAATGKPCGIGRYQVELARALLDLPDGPRLLLYAASRRGARGAAKLPAALVGHPRAKLFAPRLPAKLVALLARLPGFSTERLTGPLDLFHHSDLIFLKGFRGPEVVTAHDLAFEISRDFHDPGFTDRVGERLRGAIARARAVIVPSEATRDELTTRWQVEPAKIAVIPLGADHLRRVEPAARVDPRPDRSRPYLLHVGTLEPRKNLPRLVRAWRAARRRGLELDLALVGPWGWRTGELRAELARDDAATRDAPIVVRGAVGDAELRAWIEQAHALVYPSLHEGFGLPVAEAFALGAAVVTSARSATREVAGDAALLVDPESERELENALLEVAAPARRAELAARGAARAPRFAWEATARATVDLYLRITRGT
jgi:glycosyltransferase involved in cell wall biosynthesis